MLPTQPPRSIFTKGHLKAMKVADDVACCRCFWSILDQLQRAPNCVPLLTLPTDWQHDNPRALVFNYGAQVMEIGCRG
jgi:hypothetical protein